MPGYEVGPNPNEPPPVCNYNASITFIPYDVKLLNCTSPADFGCLRSVLSAFQRWGSQGEDS